MFPRVALAARDAGPDNLTDKLERPEVRELFAQALKFFIGLRVRLQNMFRFYKPDCLNPFSAQKLKATFTALALGTVRLLISSTDVVAATMWATDDPRL